MSYTSKYTGTEIDSLLDKVGEVGILDSVHCVLQSDYNAVLKGTIPFGKQSGNMVVNDGKVVIKPGQRVQINWVFAFSGASTTANMNFHLKDFTNNIKIADANTMYDTKQYEFIPTGVVQYTNETNENCEIGFYVNAIYQNDTMKAWNTSLTVHEIGRAIVAPSEYKEVELLSAPVEYDMTHNVLATIGKDLILNDDIANYNEVVFLVEIKNAVNEAYLGLTNIRMLTSEIVYSNDDTASTSGSSFYLTLSHGTNNSELNYWRHCTTGVHFKTGTILRVRNTITNTANYTKFRIKAIKGIKY